MNRRIYEKVWTWRQKEDGSTEKVLNRESYAIVYPGQGAIEGWRRPSGTGPSALFEDGYYGGIEVHAVKKELNQYGTEIDSCRFTGGPCWTDGSSLAYYERLIPIWGDDEAMFAELESWALGYFTIEDESVKAES